MYCNLDKCIFGYIGVIHRSLIVVILFSEGKDVDDELGKVLVAYKSELLYASVDEVLAIKIFSKLKSIFYIDFIRKELLVHLEVLLDHLDIFFIVLVDVDEIAERNDFLNNTKQVPLYFLE